MQSSTFGRIRRAVSDLIPTRPVPQEPKARRIKETLLSRARTPWTCSRSFSGFMWSCESTQ